MLLKHWKVLMKSPFPFGRQDKKVWKVMDTLSGEDFAERLETGIIGSRMKTHAYNIYWQYSELKHLKKTLGKKMSFY